MKITLGWPFPKRKSFLAELLASRASRTHELTFQGRRQILGKYAVPVELPKYRLANGRTLAAQAEHLARHSELPRDLFTRDLENDEAQTAQHALLKAMLNGAGLLKYFRANDQEEPILLSSDGFIVNGNRRICAMRELLAENQKEFARFKTVDIAILPPATDQDVFELEARLQIQPDIKDEYTWYTTAMMIRKQREDYDKSWADLADLYELREADVKDRLFLLEDAELYLADRGKEGHYHLLEGTEYAFRQLRANRDNAKLFRAEEEKVAYEKLCYCLIDENEDQGRLYEAIPGVAKYFARIVEDIRADLELEPDQQLEDVCDAADNEKNRKAIRETISNVVASEKLKEKDRKQKTFVADQIRKANTYLAEALAAIDTDTSKDGIAPQLDAIDQHLIKLRQWIKGNDKN